MESTKQYLDDISNIKDMMEKSSRFISLSGLSGVFAGAYALIGAALIYYEMQSFHYIKYQVSIEYLLTVGCSVLIAALLTGIFFTTRKAKRQGLRVWDHSTERLLINLFIPLVTGGVVCLMLLKQHYFMLVAPATLIFYGLALVSASHHTYRDIRYLGLSEVILGLIACFYIGYGLVFWAIGFGVLHILYGTVMYFKYER